MDKTLKKLSTKEMEIMRFIWANPKISSEKIYERFSQSMKKTVIANMLHNISEKGYITNEQEGRHHIYFARITELEYEQNLINQKLQKSFGHDSFESLIASFCGKPKLTEEQKKKIKSFLEELENDNIANHTNE